METFRCSHELYMGNGNKSKTKQLKIKWTFFKQGKDVSPWYEQSFSSLNQKEIENPNIEINSLYRFNDLFNKFLHEGFLENIEFKEKFFDLVVHFLSEIDLSKGLSKESIYLLQLEEEIDVGVFGKEIEKNFKAFNKNEKDKILPILLTQLKLGSSMYNFRGALKSIYPDVLLYQMKEEPNKILIYLGIKKDEKQIKKINFIIDMFLEVGYKTRIFWENHFGVGAVEQTLHLDEIELL